MRSDHTTEPAPERSEETQTRAISDLAVAVRAALGAGDITTVRPLCRELRAPDLADLLQQLSAPERVNLIQSLGTDFDFEALGELDPAVRDEITEALPNELLARAATALESDDAAYVIENLNKSDQDEILAQMPDSDRAALERNLDYPEETAGRLMQAHVVAVAPFWTVGRVIDHMREANDLPDDFQEIYIVDPSFRVLGAVDLSRLLRSKRHVVVSDIMDADRRTVLATADQEVVARQFERYGLISAPVVDENQRLVGVVTVDDVVEVIEREADEDIKALAGVGDERMTDTVLKIAGSRFWWLFVNLATAILASAVIKVFDHTLEQMIALAVLMPIVASMGGNAGTQTMTVAVRALATGELSPYNIARFAVRETAVGLLNGVAFAVLMGAVATVWYRSGLLGVVIGSAMIINLLAAALAGIFIPLALARWKFDPAVSSTVFVTTVTDVVGYFAFLGLAALLLFR
jgi:magnesium transporter